MHLMNQVAPFNSPTTRATSKRKLQDVDSTRNSLTFDDASQSTFIEKDKAGPPAPSVSAAAVPRVASAAAPALG